MVPQSLLKKEKGCNQRYVHNSAFDTHRHTSILTIVVAMSKNCINRYIFQFFANVWVKVTIVHRVDHSDGVKQSLCISCSHL